MKPETLEKLINKIKEVAARKLRSNDPDFNVDAWAGGNIDDAFDLGLTDGERMFAQELLEMIEKE